MRVKAYFSVNKHIVLVKEVVKSKGIDGKSLI